MNIVLQRPGYKDRRDHRLLSRPEPFENLIEVHCQVIHSGRHINNKKYTYQSHLRECFQLIVDCLMKTYTTIYRWRIKG